MKLLFDGATRYIRSMTIWDMGLLKFCLAAMGFIGGLFVPKEKRAPALFIAGGVFLLTYLPLMTRFIRSLANDVKSDLTY